MIGNSPIKWLHKRLRHAIVLAMVPLAVASGIPVRGACPCSDGAKKSCCRCCCGNCSGGCCGCPCCRRSAIASKTQTGKAIGGCCRSPHGKTGLAQMVSPICNCVLSTPAESSGTLVEPTRPAKDQGAIVTLTLAADLLSDLVPKAPCDRFLLRPPQEYDDIVISLHRLLV